MMNTMLEVVAVVGYEVNLRTPPTSLPQIELILLNHRPDLRGDRSLPWWPQHDQESQIAHPVWRQVLLSREQGTVTSPSQCREVGPLFPKLSKQRSRPTLPWGGVRRGQMGQKCLSGKNPSSRVRRHGEPRSPQALEKCLRPSKRMRMGTIGGRLKCIGVCANCSEKCYENISSS